MIYRSHISAMASLALHILVFLIFAGVKLYTNESIEDNIPVTFISEQKTAPLRRSSPVRPMISPDKSPLNHSPERYAVHPEYRASVEFYVSKQERVFSEVESVGQEIFQDTDIQKPSVQSQKRLSAPMTVDLLNEPHLRGIQVQPRIFDGRDLFEEAIPTQPKPDMHLVEDVLQRYFSAVRRKIESEKKYPIAAQNSGIEGRAGVEMTILKDGRLEKVEITESSGYEILDRAALQSVNNAAPFPPIPEAAKRDKIEIRIYLVFKLS